MNQEEMKKVASALPKLLSHGLVRGMGEPMPGQMCVEAAVNYAMKEPHGDQPSCVGPAVRKAKIILNDSPVWASDMSRADGLLKVAIAQLGSDQIDQFEFSKRYALKTINRLLPELFSTLQIDFEFTNVKTLEKASILAGLAARAGLAGLAADRAADAAGLAARAADAEADAADAARAAAEAAETAAADAARAAAEAGGESFLRMSADLMLEVLQEMESPGCEFLYLVEKNEDK